MTKCDYCDKTVEYESTYGKGSSYVLTCMEHIPVGNTIVGLAF